MSDTLRATSVSGSEYTTTPRHAALEEERFARPSPKPPPGPVALTVRPSRAAAAARRRRGSPLAGDCELESAIG